MKTFKLLTLSLALVIILSACLPQSSPAPRTQTADKNPATPLAALTLPAIPTATIMPTGTALSTFTSLAPNTPLLSAYNYTCEVALGGGNMLMNLAWADRSNSEEGYRVYRDGQVIATLAPDTTFYADIAYVALGKALSYSVEAFNADWQLSTDTITYGCQ